MLKIPVSLPYTQTTKLWSTPTSKIWDTLENIWKVSCYIQIDRKWQYFLIIMASFFKRNYTNITIKFYFCGKRLSTVHMHIFNLLQQQFLLLNKVLGCCISTTVFAVSPKVLSRELHFCHMNSWWQNSRWIFFPKRMI